jgi:beta-lactamase regulating signal transducer with metallopeptidase domain
MTSVIDSLNAWSEHAVHLAWLGVWQSTLLAALVAFLCWCFRRSSPALRFWLWQIVAVKLLILPFWTLSIPAPAVLESKPVAPPAEKTADDGSPDGRSVAAEMPSLRAAAPAVPGRETPSSPLGSWLEALGVNRLGWPAWLVLAWSGVVLWQVGHWTRQRRQLAKLLRQAVDANDPDLLSLLEGLCRRVGLRRPPGLLLTDYDCSPFVCGLFRPRLVLPQTLAGQLDTGRLRQVLVHELAHIRRRDLLWGWITETARLVFFFNPVAHWVYFRVCLERELACDQTAMALCGQDPADYAETLVQVVSHVSLPGPLRMAPVRTSAFLAHPDQGKEPAS